MASFVVCDLVCVGIVDVVGFVVGAWFENFLVVTMTVGLGDQ